MYITLHHRKGMLIPPIKSILCHSELPLNCIWHFLNCRIDSDSEINTTCCWYILSNAQESEYWYAWALSLSYLTHLGQTIFRWPVNETQRGRENLPPLVDVRTSSMEVFFLTFRSANAVCVKVFYRQKWAHILEHCIIHSHMHTHRHINTWSTPVFFFKR